MTASIVDPAPISNGRQMASWLIRTCRCHFDGAISCAGRRTRPEDIACRRVREDDAKVAQRGSQATAVSCCVDSNESERTTFLSSPNTCLTRPSQDLLDG